MVCTKKFVAYKVIRSGLALVWDSGSSTVIYSKDSTNYLFFVLHLKTGWWILRMSLLVLADSVYKRIVSSG